MRKTEFSALVVVLCCTSFAREASASDTYPAAVQKYWGMGTRPLPVPGKGCQLCHKDDIGGKGKATQPFGITLHQKFHVAGANVGSLRTGLAQVQSQKTNSDKDPVVDYTEIVVDGTNPNDSRDYVEPPPPVKPSEGGQGGEAGNAGASGEGGEAMIISGPIPPPPSPDDLPPPFTHGCALEREAGGVGPVLMGLLGLALRTMRRRASFRTPPGGATRRRMTR
jgi:hypothetical protein